MVASDHGRPVDPTVCDAESRARIQAHYGVNIDDVDPSALEFVVEQSRKAGNQAFKARQYTEAIRLYSQAIAGTERDAGLFSNRAAAYLAEGSYDRALWDAQKCVTLRPAWAKAHYRLGCAALGLCDWAAAQQAFAKGLELCPGDADMAARLQEAEWVLSRRSQLRTAQAAVDRRAVVARLRELRSRSARDAALRQFKQSMAGPDWDLEDLDWRPTFMPGMLAAPRRELEAMAGGSLPLVQAYLSQLADLAAPKAALAVAHDAGRWDAFDAALRTLAGRPGGPACHALVLEAGGGVLGPLVVRSGAAPRTTCVPRNRMLYRVARQVARANESLEGLSLAPCALRGIRIGGEPKPAVALREAEGPVCQSHAPEEQDPALLERCGHEKARECGLLTDPSGEAARGDEAVGDNEPVAPPAASTVQAEGWDMGSTADLLITDMLDHSVLGMGLLPAIDHAASRLLAPGAVIMPQRIQVFGRLVEVTPASAEGLDLSALEAYRWWPGAEAVTEREMPPCVPLSAPFPVTTLDLQARVNGVLAAKEAAGDGSAPSVPDPGEWEEDWELAVPLSRAGRPTAVLYWWDAELLAASCDAQDGVVLSSRDGNSHDRASSDSGQRRWRSSTPMALHYLDAPALSAGAVLTLRVRRDGGRYLFETGREGSGGRPRHALVPRWHYDMVRDAARNAAYAAAISRATESLRAGGRPVHVLDAGAGTGLLGMLAARAGAASVVGLELNRHMCDVADACLAANGALGRMTMLDRDARRARAEPGPDGSPADLDRRVDLVVYEVFDSGLIGEGVLHILAAVMHNLACRGVRLVPASARVYAQAIQLRSECVQGLDVRQLNRWRWRPDYEGVDLDRCREDWVALCDPVQVFRFDFYDTLSNMQPATQDLELQFTEAGVFNAVAMWFELDLDEETMLSTSPHQAGKGPTWQQAVQWVPERPVQPGDRAGLVATHDTYAISFKHADTRINDGKAGGKTDDSSSSQNLGPDDSATAVPFVDPVWKQGYDALQPLNSQLVRACVQNPLEYRGVALASMALAARPHVFGVNAGQAVEFCRKMMG